MVESHKGEWCEFDKCLWCQEGDCKNCEIYKKWLDTKAGENSG